MNKYLETPKFACYGELLGLGRRKIGNLDRGKNGESFTAKKQKGMISIPGRIFFFFNEKTAQFMKRN